jgi:osmotically-inducible protein OsmY
MGNDALISQTLKFHFGKTVFFTAGEDGILTRVLFDTESRRLTHLVVKQGRFFGKTHYLPFETVTRATGDGIWLNSTLAATPTIEGPGVAFDAHTVVKGSSGTGTLALVAVSPGSGELVYIVAHNIVPGRDTLLRTSNVAALSPDQITISADPTLLISQPPYRSDRELQQEVEQIMFDLPFLHIDLKGMHLRVLDSVLYMDGNISSTLRGELARDQVAGVNGLLEVNNNLVGDDTLAAQIALALGQDERTRELPIGVYPQLGVVRLSGSVHNAEQRSVATELASKFTGVRSVISNLLIDPSAEMLYVMSAQEGGEARDLVPGKFTRHTN